MQKAVSLENARPHAPAIEGPVDKFYRILLHVCLLGLEGSACYSMFHAVNVFVLKKRIKGWSNEISVKTL
jgi:hypothetical protein